MVMPKIWSQGQLFAFSALDGTAHINDDLTGILCGDKLGIRFFTPVRRELVLTGFKKATAPEFEAVLGDCIRFRAGDASCSVLFAQRHLIVGQVAAFVSIAATAEGAFTQVGDLQDTGDGDITGLRRAGDRFAYAYGHTPAEVEELLEAGLQLDIAALTEEKLRYHQQFSLDEANPYAELYAKCLSTMKTQLYSPEGYFQRIWSTPDRLPHKRLWLWDSVFHAIGHRHLHPEIAEGLILADFDVQQPDGFIPHMASPDKISTITQPPVIAWGAWKVYEVSKNKAFLQTVLERNHAFLLWCQKNRRKSNAELYTWFTGSDPNCRCDECGMDNSPRFDLKTQLEAIDYSCFMANDLRYMIKIAKELGNLTLVELYTLWYDNIKKAINQKLWCEADSFYYDYDIENQQHHKVSSVASFLPLLAGICDEKQAESLVFRLRNPAEFDAPFPIPSVSKSHPAYGTDMWRGAVWVNYNYMIAEGLEAYGYQTLATEIRDKTLQQLNKWYHKTGTLFEFYDSEDRCPPSEMNRKGAAFEPYDFTVRMQSIRDYGWSNTLCFDLLHTKYHNQ